MIEELSRDEIDELLRAELVGRIGCHAEGVTYVVPVIYAYDGEALYGHTVEGQKTRMMRANPQVCFEVDRYERGGGWRSVIVQGSYEELDGAESERALALLASRFGAQPGRGRAERARGGGRPSLSFRIRVREATGRAVRRGEGAPGR